MSYNSSDAAEQVVRMSLEGTEVAVRLAGSGAKQLAVLFYALLKDQKKTKGKIRLTNMLRSGKELKVFAVKDQDLKKFISEAKKYGVLFTVLKDRDANDGLTDILVRAEDASKINRIFERFQLSTVDMGSVKANIEHDRAERVAEESIAAPERVMTHKEKVAAFLDELLAPVPNKEQQQTENPTQGRIAKSRQSGPFSGKKSPTARDTFEYPERRPSVKKQLNEIREEQKKTAEASKAKERPQEHQHSIPNNNQKSKKRRERNDKL